MSQRANISEAIKQELIRCKQDPVYFMKKYYTIQHPTKGRMTFNLYPFQEKVLYLLQKHDYSIINKSRQLGISTLTSAFSLWMMLFEQDKNILVLATTQATAKNMVTKVRFAYDNLPQWMQLPVLEHNRLSLRLKNGSQIKAVSAAADSARSEAVSLLVIDEAAFIDRIDDIFTAAQQTLATGGRCIALSTPNGVGNWFHREFSRAQIGENRFIPISLPWTVHPERTQDWREEQTAQLGPRAAAQECDCDFSTSGDTVLEPSTLNWYQENTSLEQAMLNRSKSRAKRKGFEHNIKLDDISIPDNCPLLGIPLIKGQDSVQENSPTLDRIDSFKGYIKGNVWVISYKANTIKSNATPEELLRIATRLADFIAKRL